MEQKHHRKVRSFVRRPGRTTDAQRKALERLGSKFGVPFEKCPIDLQRVFAREAEAVLDIGFGNGEALLTLAASNPDTNYLGVEIHEPGIGRLMLMLERANLDNVLIVQADAVDVITYMLADHSLAGINLFFPDPWPKKRHHKRRLVQPELSIEFARVIQPGGRLHIATDWENYAEHIEEVIDATTDFARATPEALGAEPAALRPPTKFERRGKLLGHGVWDFVYERR